MNRFRIVFVFLFLLIVSDVLAQIPVGHKFDINGIPFNGFYDRLSYSPKNKLSISLKSGDFEPGHYYDLKNNKVRGYIKYENDKIWYKKTRSELKTMIKPEDLKSLVLGADSFFVISNFYFKRRLKDKPEFVQFLTEINGVTFVQHYHFSSAAGQQYGGRAPIIKSVLARNENDSVWDNFFKEKFKLNVEKYLVIPEEITKNIESQKSKSSDMPAIIKAAEYLKKYKSKESIYFNKFLQETNVEEKDGYSAVIVDIKEGHWVLDYYKDGVKLYRVSYSSFSPNIKDGPMLCFYSNGTIRQEIQYVSNIPKQFKVYNNKGLLLNQYNHEELTDRVSDITRITNQYVHIGDSNGVNMKDTSKIVDQILFDEKMKTKYTRSFFVDRIFESRWVLNGKKIYQVTNPNFDLKIQPLVRKLNYYLSDLKFDRALSVNAEGIILVTVVANEKGYIIKSEILNKLHPELDKTISDFVEEYLSPSGDESHRFKPLRINGKKECVEFVIPFEFSVNRFYRNSVQFNYYHNMNWFMMHNIHNMNNLALPPTPKIPIGF